MSADHARRDAALWLAARGWPVFPMRPNSKVPDWHGDSRGHPCPRTGPCRNGHRSWEQIATTTPRVVGEFWTTHPCHNIGLATGPAGLLVVDLDIAKPGKPLPADCARIGALHGAQMLSRLAADTGQSIPDTFAVKTPSGGSHLWFTQPAGLPRERQLGSTKGTPHAGLGSLIDTRGWGGCVVAPGSSTPDGVYDVVDDTPPAALPGWLYRRLAERPSMAISAPRQIAADNIDRYVSAALAREAEHVATAKPGSHNHAQWSAALALGRLVGEKTLTYQRALDELMTAAAGHIARTSPDCECTERGVRAAFAWGLDRGARNARRIDPPGGPTAA